jgi:hypothetical protein
MQPFTELFPALSLKIYAISSLAQIGQPGIDSPEEAALIFSGPQFFIALLSGVILAFGFQLLLTNLSVAAGVSYVSRASSSDSSSDSGSGTGIKTISLAFGLWTLITVSLALFFACWLAVKLSLYNSVTLGAITGLVIWATYFTLLVWFSSTTVGSLVGSVVKSATNGFQALIGTATAAIGAKTASHQVVETAEAAAAAVRREFTSGLDSYGLQDKLQDYFSSLRAPEVDVASIEQEFERLLKGSDLDSVRGDDPLPQIDQATFERLLSDRTNLSRQEAQRIANRLYRSWQKHTGGSSKLNDLMAFVASAGAGQLASEGLSDQLAQLVQEVRAQNARGGSQADGSGDEGANSDTQSAVSQALTQGLNALVGMVLAKIDLPDLDANKIIGQIRSAQSEVINQASGAAPQLSAAFSSKNLIQTDVESYLHHAYIGELKSAELEEKFRNVLYDMEADATELRQQISSLNRKVFTDALAARGMLTQAEIKDIGTRLEIVRQEVLRDVTTAEAVTAEKQVRQKLETFFRYTPLAELTTEMGDRAFCALVEDEPLDAEYLRDRLGQIGPDYFRQFLVARADVSDTGASELANRYHRLLMRVIADAEGINKSAKVRLEQQQQSLADYLRNTGKAELNPEGIQRDLQTLLHEPDQGISQIRGRLSHFDRDTFVQLLAQRPEFSETEINQVIDSVEENWHSALHAPQKITAQAQAKYDEATAAIADYLRRTGKPELSPEGIQRDLQKLIDNPKVGAKAIRYRLSKMDRDTLVQLLSQRDDMSEAEVNQTIDSLLYSIQSVIRSPRRLARRVQSQALSFETALEDYLQNTNKAELNPSGIKRDLQLLLNDPKLGASKLSDRLAQMDDSTLVALLAQRPDMSEAEAAEVVARIADVRHQIKAQIRSLQRSVESVINRIFARIREYLQSLDRPELDYYGIQRDIRTLLDDPQTGFGALRDRLSQFDRNTLVALASSHNNISEADANRVIDQVEAARDSVLSRAEKIEQQIESRINSLKAQTHHQLEDTKKAAEAASWWLFGTALVSAIVAAVGGSLAVTG